LPHFYLRELETKKNTVIIIAGPTAVGKTALAIKLANHFNTSIISADSRQCFKELTIGVAKPSSEELAAAKHYFINSHSIQDEMNVGIYEQYALEKLNEIFSSNNIAIVVGGTGLYIQALCEGIDEMPTIDANIRTEIITDYESKGLAWLQEKVKTLDPIFWQQAEQQNPQRLMRALEVIIATGTSITQFRKKQPVERPFNIIKIALELPRPILVNRINTRVNKMVEDGLLNEVKTLLDYQHLNALQTVGYQELFQYYAGVSSLSEAIERIKINTRQYAKRQMTWFKKDSNYQWFFQDENVFTSVIADLSKQLNKL